MTEEEKSEIVMLTIGSIFFLAIIALFFGHAIGVIHIGKESEVVARHWTPPVMEPEQISCKPTTKDRRCA